MKAYLLTRLRRKAVKQLRITSGRKLKKRSRSRLRARATAYGEERCRRHRRPLRLPRRNSRFTCGETESGAAVPLSRIRTPPSRRPRSLDDGPLFPHSDPRTAQARETRFLLAPVTSNARRFYRLSKKLKTARCRGYSSLTWA
jgi:hypothetical protein